MHINPDSSGAPQHLIRLQCNWAALKITVYMLSQLHVTLKLHQGLKNERLHQRWQQCFGECYSGFVDNHFNQKLERTSEKLSVCSCVLTLCVTCCWWLQSSNHEHLKDYVGLEGNMQYNVMAQCWRSCLLFTLFFDLPGGGQLCLGTFAIWSIFKSIPVFMYLNQVYFLFGWTFWNWILESHSALSFVSVYSLFFTVKMEPISCFFLSLFLVIGSSLLLSPLPLSFVSLNKAANGAWKWWQHSHVYRQTLSLLCVAVCKWKYTFASMRGSYSFAHLIHLL